MHAPALRLTDVVLRLGAADVLLDVNWTVGPGERWVVLGPNGSGKTSLLRLAAGYLHPTEGTVEILGATLGRVDVRRLRTRIGVTSAAMTKLLRPSITALDVVMTGKEAALEAWWHEWSDADRERARGLLAGAGFGYAAGRKWDALSEGERQQVQLARTLMADPELLLLDEPNAGLDLGGRERLVRHLGALAADAASPPIVLVTHHVEEIPRAFTHALLLRSGRVLAAGDVDHVLTDAALSEAFELKLRVQRQDGRFSCQAVAE
ncbi:MAG TPA: ATP-binding cassette domain-containing protein [Acidimicrobiales bacterium]